MAWRIPYIDLIVYDVDVFHLPHSCPWNQNKARASAFRRRGATKLDERTSRMSRHAGRCSRRILRRRSPATARSLVFTIFARTQQRPAARSATLVAGVAAATGSPCARVISRRRQSMSGRPCDCSAVGCEEIGGGAGRRCGCSSSRHSNLKRLLIPRRPPMRRHRVRGRVRRRIRRRSICWFRRCRSVRCERLRVRRSRLGGGAVDHENTQNRCQYHTTCTLTVHSWSCSTRGRVRIARMFWPSLQHKLPFCILVFALTGNPQRNGFTTGSNIFVL